MSTDHVDADDITPDEIELGQFIDHLRTQASVEVEGVPVPIAAGTFAMYPTEEGGIMLVTKVVGGPMDGVKHMRIPAGMIRAASVLGGGGGRLAAMKAAISRGKR